MVLGRLKLPPNIAGRFFAVRLYSGNSSPAGSSPPQVDLRPKPPLPEAIEAEWKELLKVLKTNHALYNSDEPVRAKSQPQEPWLLRLTGTSSNLQPSDFYRLAPQSTHVHYWTTQSSLAAVTQARHPTTQEGIDYYNLYFESQAGALRYRDEAVRLHEMSQELGTLLASPPPSRKVARKKAKARKKKALKIWGSFTRAPEQTKKENNDPEESAPDQEPEEYKQVSSGEEPALVQPWGTLSQRPPQSRPVASVRKNLATETRVFTLAPHGAKLVLEGPFQPGVADERPCIARPVQVLLVISGGSGNGFSRASLGRLIAADGERRNLRWKLRGGASVLPLRIDMSASVRAARKEAGIDNSGEILRQAVEMDQAIETSNQVGNDTPYMRYILSFEDTTEAKRFAREWHGRKLVFNEGDHVFFIKATTLW